MDELDESDVSPWVARVFIFCSVVLIPWIVYLAFSLPVRQVSRHYDAAWVGFDVFELIALGATGYLALRRSRYLALASAAAATLLVCDAWFDVVTSPGHQVLESVVLALVIELPLAGVCAWVSYNTQRVVGRRIRMSPRRRGRGRSTGGRKRLVHEGRPVILSRPLGNGAENTAGPRRGRRRPGWFRRCSSSPARRPSGHPAEGNSASSAA